MTESQVSYTADTIALLAYLADRLPPRVDAIFRQIERGEALLWIPSIALGECLFTLLRGKQIFGQTVPAEKFALFLDALEKSVSVHIHELGIGGWRRVQEINLPELHDRMVIASYYLTGSKALLTDDEEMSNLRGIEVVWK